MASVIPEGTNPFTWHSEQTDYQPHEDLAWARTGKETPETYEKTNQAHDEILTKDPIFKDTRVTTHASDIGGGEVVVLTNFLEAKLAVRGNHFHPVKTESFTYRGEEPAYVILATLTKNCLGIF